MIKVENRPGTIVVLLNDKLLQAFPNDEEPDIAAFAAVIFADGVAAGIKAVLGITTPIIGGGADALKP